MIGFVALFAAFITTVIAIFAYTTSFLKEMSLYNKTVENKLGTICFKLSSLSVIIASGFLLYIILTNQFEYSYVWGYSSTDLSFGYKIAAFWAGQEGSFLLWLLIHSVCGWIFIRSNGMTKSAFSVYMIVQLLIIIMLINKSPFMMMVEVQPDGAGLNPLLQNPWMAIHPPLIFIGYALLAVPFCYAIGALLTNKHQEWVKPALRWAIIAWSTLGAGLFIGGYWAYKVLGWGGYWAWDPVENSSLVPWLIATALVHLMLMVPVKIGALKPTYFAAIFSFVSVLYGTFLTRSGILSDFSVHSFSDDGIGAILATIVGLVTVLALFVLTIKWPSIPEKNLYESLNTREFSIAAGMTVFAFIAAIVFVGMSMPLITKIMGNPQSVDASFYNKTTVPLGLLMLLLVSISPILKWDENKINIYKKYWWAVFPAVLGIGVSYYYHFSNILYYLVLAVAFVAIVINLYLIKKSISCQAGIAHIGLAFMMAGIILSSAGSQTIAETFNVDESKNVFGYEVTYKGEEKPENGSAKYQVFDLDGTLLKTTTKLNAKGMEAVREPAIYHSLTGDIYFAPAHNHTNNNAKQVIVDKKKIVMENNLTFKFNGVSMESMPGMEENMLVKAMVDVTDGTQTENVVLVLAYDKDFKSIPVNILGNKYQLALTGVSNDESKIRIEVTNNEEKQAKHEVEVEVSTKPFVWLVWLGTILITISCLGAAIRRFLHKK